MGACVYAICRAAISISAAARFRHRAKMGRRVATEGQVDHDIEVGSRQSDIGEFGVGHLTQAIEIAAIFPGATGN